MEKPSQYSRAPVGQIQRQFRFDDPREQARQERLARILNAVPKVSTAAMLFDYSTATAIAAGSSPP
jgi:hypothetical protein